MRSIHKSTAAFEAWMRERTDVAEKLLKRKHRKMSESAFPFLRATFYRWVEQWPSVCPTLARRDQDVVLAVGDLHVENFGVWLDAQQRLVWGVNDFDDACELPFTSDLVRLATSVMLAAKSASIEVTTETIRRDLSDLQQRQLVQRVHGGAVPVERSRSSVTRA